VSSQHFIEDLFWLVTDDESGLIDGPMQQKSVAAKGCEMVWKQQIQRRGTPEEVGALIAWLICDDSQYITGTVQIIDGGWVC